MNLEQKVSLPCLSGKLKHENYEKDIINLYIIITYDIQPECTAEVDCRCW